MNFIAQNGSTDYRIRYDADAGVSTHYAIEELQNTLYRMTGVEFPAVNSNESPQEKEILIGAAYPEVDTRDLSAEQYVLKTVNSRLVITGGEPRGILYGVYALLSDHWDCRWFSPDVDYIPECDELTLPELDETYIPPFEQREVYMYDTFDGDWMARNRLNGTGGRHRASERWDVTSSVPWLSGKHGGSIRFGKDSFVHTFGVLVPQEIYFAEHPEYFALRDNERIPDQLCCTNEDVIRLCTEAVLEAMKRDPEATVFSCSQNDNYKHCQCENCSTLAEKEGTQMAPVLALVNRVAEAVQQAFPENIVETLAYQWTRKPPKTMQPRSNVVVRLCNYECCLSHPLENGCTKENAEFVTDLKKWAQVCDRLWIWDYIVSFPHYLLPLPNKRCIAENIRLFRKNNVTGILEQGAWNTPQSEFAELQAFARAQVLWNPECDAEQVIEEFINGYYGAASDPVKKYVDALHDLAERDEIHCTCGCQPDAGHLNSDMLAAADRFWAEAEKSAESDPELLARVQRSRMSVDYAIMDRARHTLEHDDSPDQTLVSLARVRKEKYLSNLEKSGVLRIQEFADDGLKANYIKRYSSISFEI